MKEDRNRPQADQAPSLGEDAPIARLKEKILKDYDRLGLEDKFQFGCHKDVPCFNECCGDVNIFLTPYDVLRMKNALGLPSNEFLDKYTKLPIQKDMKFPVVVFKMEDSQSEKPCQLVDSEGCTIYQDRPWPCRMYPLGMASPKDDDIGEEFYFLMKEDVCRGFEQKREWTVREWLEDQGVEPYQEFGQLYKEITLHDYFKKQKSLSPERMNLFHMACYDLDTFRRFIFDSSFLKRFDIEPEALAKIKEDDEELLRFSFRWVKFACFGEDTIPIRPEAFGPRNTPPARI